MADTIPYIALAISLVALSYSVRRFGLKRGISVRGRWTTTSSVSCEDQYVSSVLLENLKDRAATIFGIYLRLGYGCYVEVESFDESPLILRPFEAYQKEYEPITFYSDSGRRTRLDRLLQDHKTKKRLYLATSQGRYRVRSGLSMWSPIMQFFKNHLTTVVRPVRSIYKEKAYGSNVLYLVELKVEGDREQVIPIHSRQHEFKAFRQFDLTEEALESRDSL